MEKDLMREIGVDEANEEAENENGDSENEIYEDCNDDIKGLESRISNLKLEVENLVKEGFDKVETTASSKTTFLEKRDNLKNEREQDSEGSVVVGSSSSASATETESVRSVSTAATIAPDVIKKKTKTALDKRDRQSRSLRLLVRGEAAAVTRRRRENRFAIMEYQESGVWGRGDDE